MNAAAPFTIRPEQPGDTTAIGELLDAAFSGPVEARLVERLRATGNLPLALVAVQSKAIVGYAGWPRLSIETAQGTHPAVGLAPLAVSPPLQGGGVGSALTNAGLTQLRERGESLVFVLGDPAYYQRFGFSLEAARAYESIYAGDHFMALQLAAHAPKTGFVRYPAPFHSLT
jgi:putative acetyltransferase